MRNLATAVLALSMLQAWGCRDATEQAPALRPVKSVASAAAPGDHVSPPALFVTRTPPPREAVRFLQSVSDFTGQLPDERLVPGLEPFLHNAASVKSAGGMKPGDLRALLARRHDTVQVKGGRFILFPAPTPDQETPALPLILYFDSGDGVFKIDLDLSLRFRMPPATDPSPQNVSLTLAEAVSGLSGPGRLTATLHFGDGVSVRCAMLDDRAPENVAAFVSLARGLRNSRSAADPAAWARIPWYDGRAASRVFAGAGLAFARGESPGFSIPDEFPDDLRHDRPALLTTMPDCPECGAGAFAITRAPVPLHDNVGSIFGVCDPDGVELLFMAQAAAERARSTIRIGSISFSMVQ